MSKKIDSLQTVRAAAFIGVFISHTYFAFFKKVGCFSISLFLILSGFLMMHGYYRRQRIKDVTLAGSFRFAVDRIKKLYALHIFTALLIFIPNFVFYSYMRKELVFELFFNALVLHAWVPTCRNLLNYTSWFLSCLAFCYFVFPFVMKRRESGNGSLPVVRIVLLYIIQTVAAGIFAKLSPLLTNAFGLEEASALTTWFAYNFPLSRVFDFLIGTELYLLYLNADDSIDKNNTLIECLTLVVAILSVLTANRYADRWWSDVAVFTPVSCLIIYLFARSRGRLSRFRSACIDFVADISREGFLVHSVVFIYAESIIFRVINIVGLAVDPYLFTDLVRLIIGFPITVFLCLSWRKLHGALVAVNKKNHS